MKKIVNPSRLFALLLPLSLMFSAICCKTSDPDPIKPVDPNQPEYPDSLAGTMRIQFNNHVDGLPLELDTRQYKNMAGDTFTVSELKYYISNVKLKNTQTGKVYAEKNSYHQINFGENKIAFTAKGIPVKEFNQLEFSIGVDAAQNAKTETIGDLNNNDNMSWEGLGYLFMRMGGLKISKNQTPKGLLFHIGKNENYKTITMPLTTAMVFEKNKPVNAAISANVNKMFHSPNLIDFDVIRDTMASPGGATLVADNYANNMFTLQSVTK